MNIEDIDKFLTSNIATNIFQLRNITAASDRIAISAAARNKLHCCINIEGAKSVLHHEVKQFISASIKLPLPDKKAIIVLEDTGAGYKFIKKALQNYTQVGVFNPEDFNGRYRLYSGGDSLKALALNIKDTRPYLFIPDSRNYYKTSADIAFMQRIKINIGTKDISLIDAFVGFEFLFVWSQYCAKIYEKEFPFSITDYIQLRKAVFSASMEEYDNIMRKLFSQYSNTNSTENLSTAIIQKITEDSESYFVTKNAYGDQYDESVILKEYAALSKLWGWLNARCVSV